MNGKKYIVLKKYFITSFIGELFVDLLQDYLISMSTFKTSLYFEKN